MKKYETFVKAMEILIRTGRVSVHHRKGRSPLYYLVKK